MEVILKAKASKELEKEISEDLKMEDPSQEIVEDILNESRATGHNPKDIKQTST